MSSPDQYPSYVPPPTQPPAMPEQPPVAPEPRAYPPELPDALVPAGSADGGMATGPTSPEDTGEQSVEQTPPEAEQEPSAVGVIFDFKGLSPEARRRAEAALKSTIGAFLLDHAGVQAATFSPEAPWVAPEPAIEAKPPTIPDSPRPQPAAPEHPPAPNGLPLTAEQVQTRLGYTIGDILRLGDSEDAQKRQSDLEKELAERGIRTLRDAAILGLGAAKEAMNALQPSRLSGKRGDFKEYVEAALTQIANTIPTEVTNARLAIDEVDPVQIPTDGSHASPLTENQLLILEQPATMAEIARFCQSADQIPAMALNNFDNAGAVEMQPGWAKYNLVTFADAHHDDLYRDADGMLRIETIENYQEFADDRIAEFEELRPSSVAPSK